MSARTLRVVLSVVVLLLASTTEHLAAHPGSTTAVVITAADSSTLRVALHTDAEALLAKVEAAIEAPLIAPSTSRGELVARLTALGPTIARQMVLTADGESARLTFRSLDVDGGGQAVVLVDASLPDDARTATWSTSLAYGAYPVAFRSARGEEVVRWVQGQAASEPIALKEPTRSARSAVRGVWLGFTHIVPHGLDHMLFVVGLVLLTTRLRPLLLQATAFTVAHSVTLGLSLYDVVSLPSGIVEPLIALSVAYVGLENLLGTRLTRFRLGVIFGFGLLHGLGFAGAMADLGLSGSGRLGALVSFNAGVELGQVAVLAAAWLVLYRTPEAWRPSLARLASVAIGAVGLLWAIDRIAA
jgi:hypothetical protein